MTMFSGLWAHRQTVTFSPGTMDSQAEKSRRGWQRVEVNIEETRLRALLLKASVGRLRKVVTEEAWGRYFIVNKGLDPSARRQTSNEFPGSVREALGISNAKVGYVFLVDQDCRIRWAGSGNALPGEAEALAEGVRKLAEELRKGEEMEAMERETKRDVPLIVEPGKPRRRRTGEEMEAMERETKRGVPTIIESGEPRRGG